MKLPSVRPLRRWSWLALLLVLIWWVPNTSRPGVVPRGCADGCVTAPTRRDGPLRVLSLNMLHGLPTFCGLRQRLDLIADGIRAADADIVCLQEVPWAPTLGDAAAYLGQRTGLNYLFLRANGNRSAILFEEGEVILSRYPLREAGGTELLPRAGWWQHRVVLHATAATPWGDIGVFATHLTHDNPQANQGQATALAEFVVARCQGLCLVAGDLNATEDSPQIQRLAARWTDAYRSAHPDQAGLTCCVDDLQAGPQELLEMRIDYVFLVPPAGQVAHPVSARLAFDAPFAVPGGWQWASDHVGLLVEVEPAH
jgi:endonuclease/exonuclease/phosphatase family metal-dependent hydrolase